MKLPDLLAVPCYQAIRFPIQRFSGPCPLSLCSTVVASYVLGAPIVHVEGGQDWLVLSYPLAGHEI